jgi:hypothetical protein
MATPIFMFVGRDTKPSVRKRERKRYKTHAKVETEKELEVKTSFATTTGHNDACSLGDKATQRKSFFHAIRRPAGSYHRTLSSRSSYCNPVFS